MLAKRTALRVLNCQYRDRIWTPHSLGARVLQSSLFVMIRVARQMGSYSLYQPELFLDIRLQFLEMSN